MAEGGRSASLLQFTDCTDDSAHFQGVPFMTGITRRAFLEDSLFAAAAASLAAQPLVQSAPCPRTSAAKFCESQWSA